VVVLCNLRLICVRSTAMAHFSASDCEILQSVPDFKEDLLRRLRADKRRFEEMERRARAKCKALYREFL
jgi:hypothetical protein